MFIAKGAFGKVYLAKLKGTEKDVFAIKAIKKHEIIKNGLEELND